MDPLVNKLAPYVRRLRNKKGVLDARLVCEQISTPIWLRSTKNTLFFSGAGGAYINNFTLFF